MHRLWPAANKNPGLNRPTGQNMQRGARTLDAKMAEGGKAQNEKWKVCQRQKRQSRWKCLGLGFANCKLRAIKANKCWRLVWAVLPSLLFKAHSHSHSHIPCKKKKKSPTHLATFTSNAKTRCNFHCLALTLGLLAKSKLTNCAASAIWRAKISNICQRFVYLLADACFLFAATISDVSSGRKESWWGGAAPVQTWPLGK